MCVWAMPPQPMNATRNFLPLYAFPALSSIARELVDTLFSAMLFSPLRFVDVMGGPMSFRSTPVPYGTQPTLCVSGDIIKSGAAVRQGKALGTEIPG